MSLVVFDSDDRPYLDWINSNPSGYIANTERSQGSTYFMIHQADCAHISTYGTDHPFGGFTERDYIKVCSTEISVLLEWVSTERTQVDDLKICKSCNPTKINNPFQVGMEYTKQDIYRIVGVSREKQGGDWDTGYHNHEECVFIFANIGVAGRTGHDYGNRFRGDDLVWFGKTRAKLSHNLIQFMLTSNRQVYVFYRQQNLAPYTFAGLGRPIEINDTVPVSVTWAFDSSDEHHPEKLPGEISRPEKYSEGATKRVAVNVHERNPAARKICIDHYGATCQICGFDFGKRYGDLGKGFIHVHHLKLLSLVTDEYEVDPITDLLPVCPNCHAMLHYQTPPLTPEKLRKRMR